MPDATDQHPALPKWGFTDEQLAHAPHAFRDGLLKDQVVLVSGGGSGLGRAMTFLCARLGAKVVICGRKIERLQETAAAVQRLVGAEVMTQAMTIRDPAQVDALIDAIYDRHGRLDCLVNNGGGQFPQAALDYSVKGWHAVIDTNLNGTWYMMQAAGRRWRDLAPPVDAPPAPPRGCIVNIVANVWRGMPQVAHTCAARAGVIYLSKTLATEWAPLGIRVNCVSPGSVATEGFNVYPPGAADKFKDANPMRDFGDAMDIAQAVVWLAAPVSGKFVTGEVVVVDGGNNQWGDVWPGHMPDWFDVRTR